MFIMRDRVGPVSMWLIRVPYISLILDRMLFFNCEENKGNINNHQTGATMEDGSIGATMEDGSKTDLSGHPSIESLAISTSFLVSTPAHFIT